MIFVRLLVVVACFGTFVSSAQSEWKARPIGSIGATIHLYRGKGQHFPGVRLFASAAVQGTYHMGYLGYSLTAVLYSKSIGASLNPLVGDVQLDIINSATFGLAGGGDLGYTKMFRTINIGDFYNVMLDKENAFLMGTNFILNNHKRNQFVGHVAISYHNFTMDYSNDGAPPVSWFSLGDEFDRWWTGGLGIFIHNNQAFNWVEASFDQFTGYSPQLYELSGLIGIDVPRYGRSVSTDKYGPPAFNTSTYKLRVFPTANWSINMGVIGSLRSTNDTAYGLQEILHLLQGFALHPNRDINRWYIGTSYVQSYQNGNEE